MKFLDKLERKIGKYAIPHLIYYVLGAYLIGYVCTYVRALNPVLEYCTLNPYLVCKGQVWRLISWLIIPPQSGGGFLGPLWVVIMMFMYFQLGRALETIWGSFRFNVYIIGGVLLTMIGVMATYGIFYLALSEDFTFLIQSEALFGANGMYLCGYALGNSVSTYYINLSIFLAFALNFPDMQVRLYFIIPIKMKWMSIVYGAFLAYDIFSAIRYYNQLLAGVTYGYAFVIVLVVSKVVVILLSLANFLWFFLATRNSKKFFYRTVGNATKAARTRAANEAYGKPQMRRDLYSNGNAIFRHKCEVCGRTDADFPELEFRYCSKCTGSKEYCSDHLFTHTHM